MADPEKYHPEADQPAIQKAAAEQMKWVGKLVDCVQEDERQRNAWIMRQAHFVRRRYGREFRGTEWPWPGASDIVLPTIDLSIERLKPVFVQATLGTKPPVTVRAVRSENIANAPNVEAFLAWGNETKLPNFAEEVNYGSDHFLAHGFCVAHVGYEYRTRLVRETIRRDKLPDQVRRLLPVPGITEADADAIFAQTGQTLLSKSEFKKGLKTQGPQVRALIKQQFGLMESDPADKKALEEIVAWLPTDKATLSVKKRDVWRNSPVVTFVAPEHLIVPPYVTDLQNAKRIVRRLYMTEEELVERARDNRWSKAALKKVFEFRESADLKDAPGYGSQSYAATGRSELEATRVDVHDQSRAGRVIGSRDYVLHKDLFEIWEVYAFKDIDGDGYYEKVMSYIHPASKCVLKMMELPYDHGMWPFIQIKFEMNDKRFYHSRGLPERLDDLDVELLEQHRAKLNRMMIANAPVFLYRLGANINPGLLRWIPGQMYPVRRPDDIQQLPVTNTDISFEREEMNLMGWVERYVGVLDSQLTSQQQLTRPRTAEEIKTISNLQAEILGPRVLMWMHGMAKIYRMVWALWIQYGPEEFFLRAADTDSSEPIRMTRAQLQGEFEFIPTPASLNNPASRVAVAQNQLLTLTQTLPFAQFIGPRFEMDLGEAIRDYLDTTDSRRAKKILRRLTDQEMQQKQAAAQQAAQQNAVGALSGDIGQVANTVRDQQTLQRAGQQGGLPGGGA